MAETTAPVETLRDSGSALGHVTGKITVATDAAANNVSIGFVPSAILILNYTNPTWHLWIKGMTAAYVATIPATGGALAIATSGGITAYDGSASVAPGFTYGTDATLNTAGDVLYFIAFR